MLALVLLQRPAVLDLCYCPACMAGWCVDLVGSDIVSERTFGCPSQRTKYDEKNAETRL